MDDDFDAGLDTDFDAGLDTGVNTGLDTGAIKLPIRGTPALASLAGKPKSKSRGAEETALNACICSACERQPLAVLLPINC